MSKSYNVYELYDEIEINQEDYPELEGMTDQEALEYLKENMHEFEIKDGNEGSLSNEFEICFWSKMFGWFITKFDS